MLAKRLGSTSALHESDHGASLSLRLAPQRGRVRVQVGAPSSSVVAPFQANRRPTPALEGFCMRLCCFKEGVTRSTWPEALQLV
jgi:hypothetical protein